MSLLATVKEASQDFEWYPTTKEIIACVDRDLLREYDKSEWNHTTQQSDFIHKAIDILDCGAGDGRVLHSLSHGGNMYAVEKSTVLIHAMHKDIFIIGTEFNNTTLIDKKVQVIFSNPPYSEFEKWATKIIKEANAEFIYLVLPKRWKDSALISNAIKLREGKSSVLDSFNFSNAERKARVEIDVIKINIKEKYAKGCKTDPFSIWFDETFQPSASKVPNTAYDKSKQEQETLKAKINTLVKGTSIVIALFELYQQEMSLLQQNFIAVCQLDADILKELNVSIAGLKAALKQRIEGLT
jgi:hypothetical protein